MSSSGVAAEIKSKLSVLEVVGETVQLKRAGTAYKGLCPFHAEKTPSFIVSPDRETWRCFGCGEGGDIFTFLMRRDGLDFREALERLAEKAGVELSERTAREDRERKRLRDALESAIAWYREVLLQATQAERARAYLAERGLSAETLDRFSIGYAPNTWDALVKRLVGKGYTNAELIGAGLASPSNRGGVIDKFRGRIIIPIRDASGRAVGLGGRIMPGAEGPKYLNSPATRLFDKSRTLYGIDLAKAAIRKAGLTVIVEGYTDVMAAHQAGFGNVVASLGTALTHGQVELATRYADAVALAYDVDLAGEAATQRGLLEELGPDQAVSKVRVVRIPAGKDPDELIRTDPDAWRTAVAEAPPVLDYFMDRAVASVDLSSVTGRREVTRRVLGVCVAWGIGSSRRSTSSACHASSTSTRRSLPTSWRQRRGRPSDSRRTRLATSASESAPPSRPSRRRRCACCCGTRPPAPSSATARCHSARPPPPPLLAPGRRAPAGRTMPPRSRRSLADSMLRPPSWPATCSPTSAPTRVRDWNRTRRATRCAAACGGCGCSGSRTPSAMGGFSWTRQTARATPRASAHWKSR